MGSKVYFTREITPQAVVRLYHELGIELPGRVAVKVHSGEKGNQNFLRPEFWKPMVEEEMARYWSAILLMEMPQRGCGIIQNPT